MFDVKKTINMANKLKVLYVEDNKEARESTTGLFSNIFSDITIAVNGQDGLEKFIENNENYHLIISDINMPIMNGVEMMSKIKARNKDIKVIFLSACSEVECLIQPSIDIDAHLYKPINLNAFLKTLDDFYLQ